MLFSPALRVLPKIDTEQTESNTLPTLPGMHICIADDTLKRRAVSQSSNMDENHYQAVYVDQLGLYPIDKSSIGFAVLFYLLKALEAK